MKISELLKTGTRAICDAKISDTSRLDAEVLLAHVLDCDRLNLILKADTSVSEEHQKHFLSCVNMRTQGTPIAYIIGYREFMSLRFSVAPGVLIPRPDTEVLAEFAISEAKRFKKPHILDLCTGSGALAVSIAKYAGNSFVTAIDFSKICVSCAKENAKENGVLERTSIIEHDIFDDFDFFIKKADILVSNPPYIKTEIIDSLDKTVRDFEPKCALDGGDDGLRFYRRIVELAPTVLNSKGRLGLEIGYDQAEDVASLLDSSKLFSDISYLFDLAGIRRVITATLK